MLRSEPIFLETYLSEADKLSEENFLAKYDHPFAVIPGVEITSLSKLYTSVGKKRQAEETSFSEYTNNSENAVILCMGLRPKHGLSFDRMTLGRSPDADIVVLDETVSNLHAELSWDSSHERCVLTDLHSRNRTQVGEQILQPGTNARLSSGMSFAIGNIRARFFAPRAFLSWLKNRSDVSATSGWSVGLSSEDSAYNYCRRT
jgi:hypothetical protein